MVGKQLVKLLEKRGYEVGILSRSPEKIKGVRAFEWNPEEGFIEEAAFEFDHAFINLAGSGIADKRWTEKRKKILISSRVDSAAVFAKYAEEGLYRPESYISASAIGFYGNRGNEWMYEDSTQGESGFLVECTVAWENAIRLVSKSGIRTAALRIGVVLTPEGGALEKMLLPFKFGMGNWFGSGEQYLSWIHIDDLCRMFLFLLENPSLEGFYNAVAPNPVSSKDFTIAIKNAKDSNAILMPVPAFTLKLGMGEMSSIVLEGSRVSSQKIEEAGFTFSFTEAESALRDLLAK